MKELFFELPDARVIMSVADNSVHTASDVAAADIANDSPISSGQPACMLLKPIVILDGSFDPAIGREFNPHLRQEFPRVLQLGQKLFRAALPEVYMKRLITDDRGTRREIYDLAGHDLSSLGLTGDANIYMVQE